MKTVYRETYCVDCGEKFLRRDFEIDGQCEKCHNELMSRMCQAFGWVPDDED
jgi:DNA polymerase II large subunit